MDALGGSGRAGALADDLEPGRLDARQADAADVDRPWQAHAASPGTQHALQGRLVRRHSALPHRSGAAQRSLLAIRGGSAAPDPDRLPAALDPGSRLHSGGGRTLRRRDERRARACRGCGDIGPDAAQGGAGRASRARSTSCSTPSRAAGGCASSRTRAGTSGTIAPPASGDLAGACQAPRDARRMSEPTKESFLQMFNERALAARGIDPQRVEPSPCPRLLNSTQLLMVGSMRPVSVSPGCRAPWRQEQWSGRR